MTRNQAKLAQEIKREAEADPPLSREQRNRLAMLLRGGGDHRAVA
jgi:hypothetical protein